MPNDRKSGPRRLASSVEISNLVRAYGITRDQARRLINKFGNNRAKLGEAARILKARLAAPREAAMQSRADRSESSRRLWELKRTHLATLSLPQAHYQDGTDKQVFGEE